MAGNCSQSRNKLAPSLTSGPFVSKQEKHTTTSAKKAALHETSRPLLSTGSSSNSHINSIGSRLMYRQEGNKQKYTYEALSTGHLQLDKRINELAREWEVSPKVLYDDMYNTFNPLETIALEEMLKIFKEHDEIIKVKEAFKYLAKDLAEGFPIELIEALEKGKEEAKKGFINFTNKQLDVATATDQARLFQQYNVQDIEHLKQKIHRQNNQEVDKMSPKLIQLFIDHKSNRAPIQEIFCKLFDSGLEVEREMIKVLIDSRKKTNKTPDESNHKPEEESSKQTENHDGSNDKHEEDPSKQTENPNGSNQGTDEGPLK